MKRIVLFLTLTIALVLGAAQAQQLPGTLLAPDQVDPALTQALADFVPQLGFGYIGDCGLFAPDPGQVCSDVFQADDASLTVVLLDAANVQRGTLYPALQADGTWTLTGVFVSTTPPPAAPPPSPPAPVQTASPPAPFPMPSSPPPAPANSHTWYTSSASNATNYYCDDDPEWRTLSARNLQSYPTVAALLADYPNKHLQRPCLDGATGP